MGKHFIDPKMGRNAVLNTGYPESALAHQCSSRARTMGILELPLRVGGIPVRVVFRVNSVY
jgi:hypothetical protein